MHSSPYETFVMFCWYCNFGYDMPAAASMIYILSIYSTFVMSMTRIPGIFSFGPVTLTTSWLIELLVGNDPARTAFSTTKARLNSSSARPFVALAHACFVPLSWWNLVVRLAPAGVRVLLFCGYARPRPIVVVVSSPVSPRLALLVLISSRQLSLATETVLFNLLWMGSLLYLGMPDCPSLAVVDWSRRIASDCNWAWLSGGFGNASIWAMNISFVRLFIGDFGLMVFLLR